MLSAEDIITRLKATVPGLRSVEGAAELAALMASKPNVVGKPFAHVVPMGMRGGQVSASANAFIQAVDMVFTVYVTFPVTADRAGAKALPDLQALLLAVITALAGWTTGSTPDVLRLVRSGLQRFEPGVIIYAIDFTIPDQLRIIA